MRKVKKRPSYLVIDSFWSHIDAYRKEFFTLKNPRTKHIRPTNFEGKVEQ